MTTTRKELTVSGVSDPQRPACGGGVVPALPRSSSYNGLINIDDDAQGTSGAVGASGRESRDRLPLRLLGGGVERDSKKKGKDGGEDPEFALPGPSTQLGPGPRSRSMARRGSRSGSVVARRKEEGRGRSLVRKGEDEPQVAPRSATERVDLTGTRAETESPRRPETCDRQEPGPRSRRSSRDGSPNPMSVSSTGSKRTREGRDEDGIEEAGSDDTQRLFSHIRTHNPLKRRKDGSKATRGRPAKDPSHAGEFTADKIEERRKEAEERRLQEVEEWIRGSEFKAKSKRAGIADRNALSKLEGLSEAPTASITQLGINAVEVIKKVATSSKNIKGSLVGELWRAAEDLTALNMVLTKRAQPLEEKQGGRGTSSEIEEMRREISSLRTSEALLQGQVKALRETLARGEAKRLPTPPDTEAVEVPRKRRRKKRGEEGYTIKPLDTSTSSDEDRTADMTPIQREMGKRAREEVLRDLLEGTMPPAVRPPIQGRSLVLGVEEVPPVRAEVLSPRPCTKPPAPPSPVSVPEVTSGRGWGLEEVVQAVIKTLVASGLIPSPGPVKATPDRGPVKVPEESRGREDGAKKAPPPPPQAAQKTASEAGQGGKKKKKKKKKGRKRNAGAETPAPDPAPQKGKGEAPQPTRPAATGGNGKVPGRRSRPGPK